MPDCLGDAAVVKAGVSRRHFLKAAAVFCGGIPGSGFIRIADAATSERIGASVEAIMIGVRSGDSTDNLFPEPIRSGLRIASGDKVTIETGFCPEGMATGINRSIDWATAYKKEMAKRPDRYFPAGSVTGSMKKEKGFDQAYLACPIGVEGAKPGDILQMEIFPDGFLKGKTEWFWTDPENDALGALPLVKTVGSNKDLGLMRSNAAQVIHIPVCGEEVRIITGGFRFEESHGKVGPGALREDCRSITLRVTIQKDLKAEDLPNLVPNHRVTLGIRSGLFASHKEAAIRSKRLLKDLYGVLDKTEYIFCNVGVNQQVSQYVGRRVTITHMQT